MNMQKPVNELIAEVTRVINAPPSRPVRLMFLENEIFYEMAQNQVKELFASNEIINMTNFMDFEAWKSREDELIEIEEKYGQDHKRYRQVLCEILEKVIVDFIKENDAEKVLVIQDETLFTLGLDPIHFLLTYMSENQLIINDSIPLIWLTVGTKEDYSVNEYCYYKTESTKGRAVKIVQSTLSACVKDYRLPE
ncbi:MAG: hypothetical protein HFG80_00175 [Eubacterium sp.]|nr:hypothetical protein [Eubacterium sp.]